VKRLEKS